MDILTSLAPLALAIFMFFVGRFFSQSDKKNDKVEKLEDKSIDELRKNIDEKFNKFEALFVRHTISTDASFATLNKQNKEIDLALNDFKVSSEILKQTLASNQTLSNQTHASLKQSIDDLKKTVDGITQVTIKTSKARATA
jgi:hypothetical protein